MGRRMRRVAAITAAVAMAALGVTSSQVASRAEAAAPTNLELRVIQHNIEGGFRNAAGVEPIKALDGVVAQIKAFNPQVVMMEEVCWNQYQAFQAKYKGWTVKFATMVDSELKCTDRKNPKLSKKSGQVLASPYPFANLQRWGLPGTYKDPAAGNPNRIKKFILMCADIAIPKRPADGLRACVTHLIAAPDPKVLPVKTRLEYRAAQVNEIRKHLKGRYDRGQALVLGGDFNMDPWNANFDNIYSLSRNGKFETAGFFNEADQTDKRYFGTRPSSVKCGPNQCRTGQRTADANPKSPGSVARKIDYVFISRNVTHGMSVSALPINKYGSDHYLYRALFNIRY